MGQVTSDNLSEAETVQLLEQSDYDCDDYDLEDHTFCDVTNIHSLGNMSSLDRRTYLANLKKLQVELVKLQNWVVHTGEKILIIFEGRDASGKGGIIKRLN